MKKIFLTLPYLTLIIFTSASFFLMLNAARTDSAIMDELAHIPAGYGYVKYLDYRLNPEHPPLVKIISAIPLLFANLNFPTDKSSWTTDLNGQWTAGAQFLYESGNSADKIIFLARLGPILLTLLLIIFVYFFARKLIGRWWALLPAFFVALSPNFLAHGHYVTTDVGATLGTFLAIFGLLNFLLNQSSKNLVISGILFGIAQVMKFSSVLLIPYFIFIIFVFYLVSVIRDWPQVSAGGKFKKFGIRFIKYARSLLAIFFIGYLLVYVVYFVTTLNYPVSRQVSDTTTTLGSFGIRPLANLNIWMAGNKILRPIGQYMLGVLMVVQRSAGGNTGYFMGEVSAAGWPAYFPMVFIMKEALPILITILISLVIGLWNTVKSFKNGAKKAMAKFNEYLKTNFEEFALISFIVLYWAYSLHSTLNIGFRHLMPTLPLIYILCAGAIKKWLTSAKIKTVLLSVIIIWLAYGTFSASPFFLSRFNELFGGTYGGYKYVTDSNFDWGQDLKRLKTFVEENKIDKIAIDYFGGGSLKYYLGDKAESWWSSRGNPKEEGIDWIAVSVNTIQGALGKTATGFVRNPQDGYPWLENPYAPFGRAGTSIFIYKL